MQYEIGSQVTLKSGVFAVDEYQGQALTIYEIVDGCIFCSDESSDTGEVWMIASSDIEQTIDAPPLGGSLT